MGRWGLATFLGIVLLGLAAAAEAREFRILYAEPVQAALPLPQPRASMQNAAPATLRSLSFLAYGQQFELTLEPNERLLAALPAAQREAVRAFPIYRGHLNGVPGSWVRLTQVGAAMEGAIWDGHDLYTLEPARRARPFMLDAASVASAATVIYRLSDTLSDLGPQFCGVLTPPEEATSLAGYKALVAELQANQPLAAAATLTGQIQVAVVGDFEFFTDHLADAESVVLTRMNVVDGIFSEQVGVHIVVSSVKVFNTDTDPFTTTVPRDLLNQLADYKNATASIRGTAIAHLMTGRNLDGTTVGIAFLASLCNPRFGVSLSEGGSEIGSTSAALVAAHEMGHNFGAPHDAEPDSSQNQACASTPPTFLMAASLNGSSTFSQCSLDQIRPVVSGAACIQAVALADGMVSASPASVSALVNQPLAYSLGVSSVGTATLNAATLSIAVPASVSLQSATPDSGSCSTGAGSVTCDLGTMPAGTSRRIDMVLLGSQMGTFSSSAVLAASNDSAAQNNSASVTLLITEPTSTSPPPARSGGGGGATGALETLALLLALSQSRRLRAAWSRA